MVHVHLQVSLTFVVYDWDGPLVGDDLLGVAKLNLTKVRPHPLHPAEWLKEYMYNCLHVLILMFSLVNLLFVALNKYKINFGWLVINFLANLISGYS